MSEAADDAPNVLTISVLVLLVCTSDGNSDNDVVSMIFMVLFNHLKISATKMNSENFPAGGGARG